MICDHCKSSDVENNIILGNVVCNGCGAVLEENTIVSEVQFSENANGAAVLQGTFCSKKGRPPAPSLFGSRRFHQSDSREWTISNAKSRLQSIAYAIQLSDHHVESAHRWYILSLQHNFTRGRKSQNIAASCLYIVCRQEKTSHMLLDFADVLRTNVYELGNMYVKLCRLLNLDIPLIDPSLYIERFAAKLEFGDKTRLVGMTALRLVSRMKRDWIQTGRRPAGICGACLLISARLYGFSRSQKEVISVVRVCDLTLRKRLNEFGKTPTSMLTPEEFHYVWLEQENDPPSFTANREKEKMSTIENSGVDKENNGKIMNKEYKYALKCMEEIKDEDLDLLISDKEIEDVLLDEEEVRYKTEAWLIENGDYLKSQVEKESREKVTKITKPRKKRQAEDKKVIESSSAAQATVSLFQTKKFSKKFNYKALDSLLSSKPIQKLSDYIQCGVTSEVA